jgi:hypothetical protein
MKLMHRTVAAVLAATLALMATPVFAAGADDKEAGKEIPIPQVRAARGAVLPSLYVSLAALNAYDGFTTIKGLRQGARESNALMAPVAGSAPAIWLVKGSVTAGSILVAERLWKSHRRAQAIAVLAISNGMMAAVAARKTAVLRQQR